MSKTVIDLFQLCAVNNENKTAIFCNNVEISYRELFSKASAIASYLLDNNLSSETPVSVLLDRNESYIISILGIILAGGYYIPLDKNFPKNRIDNIVKDLGSIFVIDEILYLKASSHNSSDLKPPVISGHNLCYTIFTSGSTGKPKGVSIEHSSLVNLLLAFENIAPADSIENTATVCPFTFDVSVWEIFSALCFGRTLHILDNNKIVNAKYFSDYIINNSIQSLYIPPGMLEPLAYNLSTHNTQNIGIKRFLTGVEPIKQSVLSKFKKLNPDLKIINGYGPTEATICSTFYAFNNEVNPDDITPIGKEIENYSVKIVDEDLNEIPACVQGEIIIAGAGLARGYINLPEETGKRFINSVFENCKYNRFYKTGDFGYKLSDGNIMFSGRKDNQIKFRGYRIELEEIEKEIIKINGIKESCVLLKKISSETSTLIAYYSPKDLSESEVNISLKQLIPDYMMPVTFVKMKSLPRTDAGKIDKKALSLIPVESVDADESFIENIQERLKDIWKDILKKDCIEADDNFFESGGNSLESFNLISKIYSHTSVEISFKNFFNTPTIDYLAKEIKSKYNQTGISKERKKHLPVYEFIPASPGQARIYFIEEFSKGSGLFNIPLFFRINGDLYPAILEQSVNILIKKNESLRTSIINKNGELYQNIQSEFNYKIITEDISHLDNSEINLYIEKVIEEEDKFNFNLSELPLFRIRLFRLAPGKTFLSINLHHIISDNRSVGIFIEKLSDIYNKISNNEYIDNKPDEIQYKDFSVFQKENIENGIYENEKTFWLNHLKNADTVIQLPADYIRPKHQSFNGDEYHFLIDYKTCEGIMKFCKSNGISPFMFLFASYSVFISKYTSRNDFIIGIPIANRNRTEFINLIGMMINNLPLRIKIKEEDTFNSLLGYIKNLLPEAYDNQNIPFEIIVDSLNLKRNPSYSLLIQTMFNSLTEYRNKLNFKNTQSEIVEFRRKKSHMDLTMMFYLFEKNIRCIFEYNTDLFSEERIKNSANHFIAVCKAFSEKPDCLIKNTNILSKEDANIYSGINNSATDFDYNIICEMISDSAAKYPDKIAVKFKDKTLSYREFDKLTDNIASNIISLTKSGKSKVALYLSRSEHLILAITGVLKSGNCYIPLDPDYPEERIKYIIDIAKPDLIITDSDSDMGVNINNLTGNSSSFTQPKIEPGDTAYIIFTSGSTGKPKGVEVSHKSLANLIQSINKTLSLNARVNLLNVTTYSFDISILEFFVPLCLGGTLSIASKEEIYDGKLLSEIIEKEDINLLQATQVTFKILNESGWQGKDNILLLCGGEAFPKRLAKELFGKCKSLYNVYGPTETTIWSSVKKVEESDLTESSPEYISIGKPLHNTKFFVLDENNLLLPAGIPGQLAIGGDGIAKGYYNDSGLTAEKFKTLSDIINESGKEKYFLTGDTVAFDYAGNFHFKERKDSQIKIRGFRIDLSEIEFALSKIIPGIDFAVKAFINPDGDNFIALYIAGQKDTDISGIKIKSELSKKLPVYMIPAYVTFLESMPLTPNNKIDKNKLPLPDLKTVSYSPSDQNFPETEIQKGVAKIWNKILKKDFSGINEDFFETGGNSLLAVKLVSDIENIYRVRLPLSVMFESSTIEAISSIIEKEKSLNWKSLVPIKKSGSKQPLYIIHGAGLNLLLFNTLKSLMDKEQPIYGLQASGLDGKTEPLKTVEEMASHYISEIIEFDKSGVYSLAGVSFGGIIAYEIAKQLTESGYKVNFTGLFDAVAYSSNRNFSKPKRLLKTVTLISKQVFFAIINFFEIPGEKKKEFILIKLKGIARRFGHKQYYEFEKRVDIGLNKKELNEIPAYMKKLMETNYKALDNYIIKPAAVKVTLFKAKLRTFYIEDFKYYGWKKYAINGIDVIEVPGDHNTTFAPPNDKLFANILQKKLDSREK